MFIEEYRKHAVESALATPSVQSSIDCWIDKIHSITNGKISGKLAFDLGDHLREIFFSSAQGRVRDGGSSNSSVATGGAAWESLVCWYMNLCLIGTNIVVIKSKKDLLPEFITDAIAVKYNNFKSNTEADLICIAFPDRVDWPAKGRGTYSKYLDDCESAIFNIRDVSIGIIQTKTNWNDNAQIPMLWDMVYSANGFGRDVTVGSNGKSISSFKEFSYAFVTVPSQKSIEREYKVTSTSVNRVKNLSGGNYWGLPSKNNIADSIKEYFGRNFGGYIPDSNIVSNLDNNLKYYNEKYTYFGIFDKRDMYLI